MAVELFKINDVGEVVISPEALVIPVFDSIYTRLGRTYLGYVHFMMSKKANNHYATMSWEERHAQLVEDLKLNPVLLELDPSIKEAIDYYQKHYYTSYHKQYEGYTTKVLPKLQQFIDEFDGVHSFKEVAEALKAPEQLANAMESLRVFKEKIEAADRDVKTSIRGKGSLSVIEKAHKKGLLDTRTK